MDSVLHRLVLGLGTAWALYALAETTHDSPIRGRPAAPAIATPHHQIPNQSPDTGSRIGLLPQGGIGYRCVNPSSDLDLRLSSLGLDGRIRAWACDVPAFFDAHPGEKQRGFCQVDTDFRNRLDGLYYYESDSTRLLCRFGSEPADNAINFFTKSDGAQFQCRAAPDLQEVLLKNPDSYLFVHRETSKGVKGSAAYFGELFQGWVTCERANEGPFAFQSKCSLGNESLRLSCEADNGGLTGRCDAERGNCRVSCGYGTRDSSWNLGLTGGDGGSSYFATCEGKGMGELDFAGGVIFPVSRIRSTCALGGAYSPQKGPAAGLKLHTPCGFFSAGYRFDADKIPTSPPGSWRPGDQPWPFYNTPGAFLNLNFRY